MSSPVSKPKYQRYDIHRPWNTLDDWQREYINSEDDCLLVAGRQVGKTTAMAIKIGNKAVNNPNSDILIGALTEKQAFQVFIKALAYIKARHRKHLILTGSDKPTKHEFRLKNGSVVRAYALGLTGMGMRTFTITDLFIDECREIAREVFISLEPMISVTKGTKNYASTPGGKRGYFYEMSKPENGFKVYHVNAYECPRHEKEWLDKQKEIMTKVEFAQEYLGEFLDNVLRVFPDELLKAQSTLQPSDSIKGKAYGGVDVARLGTNKSAFTIFDKIDQNTIKQKHLMTTREEYTTQTSKKILELHKKFKCKKWGIDGAGVGGGVFDQLLEEPKTKYKVVDLNNARKVTSGDEKSKKRLLKEEMYINTLRLLEHRKLWLLDDEEQLLSMASALYEYDDRGNMRVFGENNDIREAVIRGTWLAAKDKTLNLWASSILHAKKLEI